MPLRSDFVPFDYCLEVSAIVLVRVYPAALSVLREVGHHIEALVAVATPDSGRGEVVRGRLGDGRRWTDEDGPGFASEGVTVEDAHSADMSSL